MATTSEKFALLLHTNAAGTRKNAAGTPLQARQLRVFLEQKNRKARRDKKETRTGKKREEFKTAQTELGRWVYPWPHGGTRDLFSWALHPIIGLSPSDSIYFTCDLLPAIALAQVAKVVLHTIVLFGTLAIVEAI